MAALTPDGLSLSATLTNVIVDLHKHLKLSGIPFADMRSAASLELAYAGASNLHPLAKQSGEAWASPEITRLEGRMSIQARPVPWPAATPSRLCYFLDGSQRTMPVMRVGVVPIVATIAAAGILQRDKRGAATILPGTLRLERTWLVPRRTRNPHVEALIDRLDAVNAKVVDPLESLADPADYALMANNYGKMVEAAYVAARDVRAEVEIGLLDDWGTGLSDVAPDAWLVVDGRLRLAVPRALGLVKDLTSQHLTGAEALELFNLQPGHRTTAFHPSDRRRSIAFETKTPQATGDQRPTLWYLRMRSCEGMDARHALIRIEAPNHIQDTDSIDQLSSWLLAERSPRPTADARWDTLLYPVHYLEQILKRHVAGSTRGWPGAR
ncbi:MAG TPA: hypothetical protein VGR16_06330 [Thermomicrobiales bacterium]|nr:hypothetical protein [Thermomicrobiales bacterium]